MSTSNKRKINDFLKRKLTIFKGTCIRERFSLEKYRRSDRSYYAEANVDLQQKRN
jgi:hypothetical protein